MERTRTTVICAVMLNISIHRAELSSSRMGGSQAAFWKQHGLVSDGAHYRQDGGHPNSWVPPVTWTPFRYHCLYQVASNRATRMFDGNISYDMDPMKVQSPVCQKMSATITPSSSFAILQDRMSRIARFDGIISIVGQVIPSPVPSSPVSPALHRIAPSCHL